MSKPHTHALSSAEKFGGVAEDYLEIHKFMDGSKIALADPRHRAIFHSAYGVFVVEYVFGDTLENSDGKIVSTRDVAEQHILEDLGFIPTLEKWFEKMPIEPWMSLHLKEFEVKEEPSPKDMDKVLDQIDTVKDVYVTDELVEKIKAQIRKHPPKVVPAAPWVPTPVEPWKTYPNPYPAPPWDGTTPYPQEIIIRD